MQIRTLSEYSLAGIKFQRRIGGRGRPVALAIAVTLALLLVLVVAPRANASTAYKTYRHVYDKVVELSPSATNKAQGVGTNLDFNLETAQELTTCHSILTVSVSPERTSKAPPEVPSVATMTTDEVATLATMAELKKFNPAGLINTEQFQSSVTYAGACADEQPMSSPAGRRLSTSAKDWWAGTTGIAAGIAATALLFYLGYLTVPNIMVYSSVRAALGCVGGLIATEVSSLISGASSSKTFAIKSVLSCITGAAATVAVCRLLKELNLIFGPSAAGTTGNLSRSAGQALSSGANVGNSIVPTDLTGVFSNWSGTTGSAATQELAILGA